MRQSFPGWKHRDVCVRCGCCVCVPRVGSPVRELVVAHGGNFGGADVLVVRARGCGPQKTADGYFRADRVRRAGRLGMQECHFDHRVCEASS